MLEKPRRDGDLVGMVPDGLAHDHGGPVVFALPLDLATEGRGLLDDGVVVIGAVETQLREARRGQPSVRLRVAAGVRERRTGEVHQFDGHDGAGVDDRGPIHGLARKGGEHSLAGLHSFSRRHC